MQFRILNTHLCDIIKEQDNIESITLRRIDMGIVRGLNALNQQMEKAEYSGEGQKGTWLKINDGQSVKIRFMQEIDPNSENYTEQAGTAFIAVEHTNPESYQRKALCSIEDQGRCFGCEQHRRDPKAKWGGKKRFYANVIVDDGVKEPYVAILSQGLGPKAVTETVIAWAGETGSITNTIWKVKRTGKGATDTSYSAIPLPTASIEPIDFAKYELFNLEKTAVRDVPYEEQEAFYFGTAGESALVGASSSPDDSSSSIEW